MPMPKGFGSVLHGTSRVVSRNVESRVERAGSGNEYFHAETITTPAVNSSALLQHTDIIAGSVVVKNAATGVAYADTMYSVNLVSGRITNLSLPAATSVVVSYHHEDPGIEGHLIYGPNGERFERRSGLKFTGVTITDDPNLDLLLIQIAGGMERIWTNSTAPATPHNYTMWLDTSTTPATIKRWTGSAWTTVQAVPSTHSHPEYAAASHVGAGGTAHPAATSSVAGFMSATDKTNWDALKIAWDAHKGAGGTAHALVTTTSDGFMRKEDKAKLDGIPAGGGGGGGSSDGPPHVIQDNTTDMPQRTKLRFRNGLSLVDAPDATIVDVIGGSGGGGSGFTKYATFVKLGAV